MISIELEKVPTSISKINCCIKTRTTNCSTVFQLLCHAESETKKIVSKRKCQTREKMNPPSMDHTVASEARHHSYWPPHETPYRTPNRTCQTKNAEPENKSRSYRSKADPVNPYRISATTSTILTAVGCTDHCFDPASTLHWPPHWPPHRPSYWWLPTMEPNTKPIFWLLKG